VLVLTEVRDKSAPLLEALRSHSWDYIACRTPREACGGVAILSRTTLRERPAGDIEESFAGRWVEVDVIDDRVSVIGVYGPLDERAIR
jgi:hypothetical protein